MMRALLSAALVAAITFGIVATPGMARADFLSVSGDIPVQYSFSEQTLEDPNPSGFIVALSLPFLVGIGYESYSVDGDVNPTTGPLEPFEYDVTMVDIFFDLPFPVANLRIGGGVGTGEFALPQSPGTTFEDAGLTQLFFNVGIPFGGVFDAHVGYHKISGEADITGGGFTLNLDSSMATIGLKVGF